MAIASSLEIYEDTYQLTRFITEWDRQLCRTFKPTIGKRAVDMCLDLFGHIESANRTDSDRTRTYHQEQFLIKLETLKTILRLAHDTKLMSDGQLAHASRFTTSIGKQMTAWKNRK